MNSKRNISAISTITIIVLATQFVFMMATPTHAYAWHWTTRCPCKPLKTIINDTSRARSIGADLVLDACTEGDNIKSLNGETLTCGRIIYDTQEEDGTDLCALEAEAGIFCCRSSIICIKEEISDNDLRSFIRISPISEPEYEACRRELNQIAHFLDLECTPPE